MKDYSGVAVAYARKVADPKNKARHGKWMRLAAQRFLNDLERKDFDSRYDHDEAFNVCDFVEKLQHVEGVWYNAAGERQLTIELHESHIFFLCQLFGWRNRDGTRRFTTAVFAIARKNAKSTLAAAIALYCQCCEGEEGPQVISAATTYDQAAIIFKIAKRMVEKDSDLQEAFELKVFAKGISSRSNGGSFKALHSKASTQDGLNPSCTVVDEVHAHQDGDLINVLKSAAGARRNPLFLYTTTEGYDSPGPWGEMRHFMKQVLSGAIAPGDCDHMLFSYYAVDDEERGQDGAVITPMDDDFDEAAWLKANPLMESNDVLLKEIRKESGEAKHMPGKLAEFRIKRLNRPSSVAGGWINLSKWRQCGTRAVDLKFLEPYPCWGGLDLASTSDLASLRLVWNVEGVLWTHGRKWVPADAVNRRVRAGLVPYRAWVEGGHLSQAGQDVTDYNTIRSAILEVKNRFQLKSLSYDPWNATESAQLLSEAGVPMTPFIQGPKSYHPAMQALEVAYMSGKFEHGNDPVLNWCASNIVARTDQNLNKAPDKKKSNDKIDDMVALLMAVGGSITQTEDVGTLESWLKATSSPA